MASDDAHEFAPHNLFYMACRAQLAAGPLDAAGKARLKEVQRALRVPRDMAGAVYARAQARTAEKSASGERRPFDPADLLGRACVLAWRNGSARAGATRSVLARLARALGLHDATLDRLIARTDPDASAGTAAGGEGFMLGTIPAEVSQGHMEEMAAAVQKVQRETGLRPTPTPEFEDVAEGWGVLGWNTAWILLGAPLAYGGLDHLQGWLAASFAGLPGTGRIHPHGDPSTLGAMVALVAVLAGAWGAVRGLRGLVRGRDAILDLLPTSDG